MIRFARLVSYLLHPGLLLILMPYLIVYRETYNSFYAFKWLTFSSLFTLVIFGILIIGQRRGIFSDADISIREQRYRFYLFGFCLALIYLATAVYFKGILFSISIAAIGSVVGIAASALINYFYIKDSIHMAVLCAFVITLGILYGPVIFALLVWTIPLMAWSRITLKRHTISEVIVGSILGSITTILTFLFAQYLYR